MKQQSIKSFIAPILVGKVFPYAVVVKATDADGPGEYEANGLMYENGHVLIEYPFRRPGQSVEQAKAEGADPANQNQIDITTAVLPDGTELTRGEAWEEIAYPSSWSDRVKAAIAAHGEASFLRGDQRLSDDGHAEGARLSAELNQAEDNLYSLLGLKGNADKERTSIKVADIGTRRPLELNAQELFDRRSPAAQAIAGRLLSEIGRRWLASEPIFDTKGGGACGLTCWLTEEDRLILDINPDKRYVDILIERHRVEYAARLSVPGEIVGLGEDRRYRSVYFSLARGEHHANLFGLFSMIGVAVEIAAFDANDSENTARRVGVQAGTGIA